MPSAGARKHHTVPLIWPAAEFYTFRGAAVDVSVRVAPPPDFGRKKNYVILMVIIFLHSFLKNIRKNIQKIIFGPQKYEKHQKPLLQDEPFPKNV